MQLLLMSVTSSVVQGIQWDSSKACSLLHWCRIQSIWTLLTLPFREGNGTPLQYSCLENPMDGGAWLAAVHGVARSQTQLSDFTFTFHFHALEKEMATHSSVLAWKIPGTGEPDGLPSMGSQSWSDLAAAAAAVTVPLFSMKEPLSLKIPYLIQFFRERRSCHLQNSE